MSKEIKFKEIEAEVKPWVNGAEPSAVAKGKDVSITYSAEKENEPGEVAGTHTVKFKECLMYRVGDPNEHGFYQAEIPDVVNKTVYSKVNFPDLEFYTFNEVTGVDWKNELLGEGTEILDDKYRDASLGDYKHYLWFMRDGTFECIAKSYENENK